MRFGIFFVILQPIKIKNLICMKVMWMIIFFVLPIVGLSYVLWHIWQMLPWSNPWRWTAVGIALACFLTMFLGFSGAIERMPLDVASVVYEIGNSAIFVLLYLVMIFLVLDLGRAVHLIPKAWLFGNGYTSLGVFAVMLAIFGYGNAHYYNKVRQPLEIKTDKVISLEEDSMDAQGNDSMEDAENDSLRSFGKKVTKIVLLSDLHLGYHNRRSEFKKWVDLINAEHPDLILIGGDIIDISVRPLLEENVAEEFHCLKAPVYACLGNHEYYSGEPKAQQFYRDAGIHLLRDSVAKIGNIAITGRDDRSNPHRKSIAEIIGQAERNRSLTMVSDKKKRKEFTILLDHQPYHLEEAEQNGIDFQFSGHTHHGQVWPISWITDAIYEDAFGPLRKGDTQYYVSSGMGIWGGKFRIGTRSEYVVLTLQH